MNPMTFIANTKAAFQAMMSDELGVDQDTWCLEGIDVDGGNLVFRCVDQTLFMESIPFSLSVPADVVDAGLDVEALLAVAAKDEMFLFDVRRLHEASISMHFDRQRDIEVDLLLTEEERQDRDSQRYVDYHIRLGVDPALL